VGGTPVKIRELLIGLGFAKQVDIATPLTATSLVRFRKLNADTVNPHLNTENDSAEIGKGNEFATETFNTSWDVGPFTLDKFLGSQVAAILMAFGLGNVVKSGTSPNFTYTCTPIDPTTAPAGLELPYMSYVEQLRPGASAVIDRIYSGCAVEEFNVVVTRGPGRANSKITASIAGCGRFTAPSTIVLPALAPDVLLPAASLTFSAQGVDYVTAKTIEEVSFGLKNNIDLESGFFPGSGFQTPADANSGAVRGRLEIGDRTPTIKYIARLTKDSAEYAALQARTTGPVIIGLSNGTNHSLLVTFWKCAYQVVTLSEKNNVVMVEVTCLPEWDATNGLMTAVIKTDMDGICQAAA
jgi:hypothetical protein